MSTKGTARRRSTYSPTKHVCDVLAVEQAGKHDVDNPEKSQLLCGFPLPSDAKADISMGDSLQPFSLPQHTEDKHRYRHAAILHWKQKTSKNKRRPKTFSPSLTTNQGIQMIDDITTSMDQVNKQKKTDSLQPNKHKTYTPGMCSYAGDAVFICNNMHVEQTGQHPLQKPQKRRLLYRLPSFTDGHADISINKTNETPSSPPQIRDIHNKHRQEAISRWKEKTSRNKITRRKPPTVNKGRELLQNIAASVVELKKPKDCSYCGAKKFKHETTHMCCSNGDVTLANNSIPDEMKLLLTDNTLDAKTFRCSIRTYNNHLAFTSLGVRYDKELSRRNKGVYTFRVQGQVYHFLDDLLPHHNSYKNLQLYFYDTDYEVPTRLAMCSRLSEPILHTLLDVIERNPYARFFRGLRNIPNIDNKYIFLQTNPRLNQKVYNKPTVEQVSVILNETDECEASSKRNIRVYTQGGNVRSINYYYGCYDPLQYPLMFPYGEIGWHQGITRNGVRLMNKKKRKRFADTELDPLVVQSADELLRNEEEGLNAHVEPEACVSMREYYSYKFQIRDKDESYILRFGRLFQQFVVDMYVKLETQRLDFYRSQQNEIRQEYLQGVADAIASGETDSGKIGQRIILPAGFTHGPRNMRRKYIDAMALVQKHGKPDLFLTMTCNSNWREIKEHLLPSEEAQNRPDLIVRVFHAKLEELKHEILDKQVFGEVAAYTYVIEYQKRGLPHAHFLIILKPHAKLFRPEEYDRLVSAELPDKSLHPYLHDLVVRHMMHGPCGPLNPSNVCMQPDDGGCRSSYPKEFCDQTTDSNDAYPKYRRRNDGRKVKVRGAFLDNRWVVSYPPYLVAKLDCHINLEVCSTIKAVKYIYKYICKGNDKILYKVGGDCTTETIDEIHRFVSGRWISAPEALWRIFRFAMSDMRPAVVRLPLHLENYQPLIFKKKDSLPNIVNNPVQRKTMLTEYFYMNRTSSDAKRLNCTYPEFPNHFVWLASDRRWKLRQRGDSVGRIVNAHPSEGERYYMRILLANISCPLSYNDLKIYNGVKANTFREAALNRGLLQDDNSQELCLEEASLFNMPYELRRLFANILVYSCPNDPKKLWLMFKKQLSEDYKRNKLLSEHEIQTKVLQQINGFLQSMGKHLNTYSILDKEFNEESLDDVTKELENEKNVHVSLADLESVNNLNVKQKEAYDLIINSIYENKKGAFFVDGPGGTGKTYLYRSLLAELRSKGYIALATATSGIAASILPGGRTAHSRFKIPIDESEGSTCRVSKQSGLAMLIKQCALILWDEAPMAKRAAIEALDILLQDLMDTNELFGGKIVVLGGDFRQTLPVVKQGTMDQIVRATIISSNIWPKLKKIHLTENMRALHDPNYAKFILDIGNGTLQQQNIEDVKLPKSILLHMSDDNAALDQLINKVYPTPNNSTYDTSQLMNRAILTTKNSFVDDINQIMIDRFPGDAVDYFSFDETFNPNDQGQYVDIINSITPNGLPPHHLILKVNAPIILLRNLDPSEGLCNGTRLICRALQRNVIHAEIVSGDFKGRHVFINRIPLQPPKDDYYPVPYKRTQFPIRLSFALTINKAQGQTLEYVAIYLKEPVFAHGQLYVALSRARTSACIQVVIKPAFYESVAPEYTKNVVYKHILKHS